MNTNLTRTPLLRALAPFRAFAHKYAARGTVWIGATPDALTFEALHEDGLWFCTSLAAAVEEPHEELCGVAVQDFLRVLRYAPENITLVCNGNVSVEFADGHINFDSVDDCWHSPQSPWADSTHTVPVDKLRNALARVYKSCSDDPQHNGINCVRLLPQDGHVLVEALNGHMYRNSRFESAGLAALLPEKGLLIRRANVAILLSILHSHVLGDNVTVTLKKSLCLRGTRGAVSIPLCRAQFPNTEQFMEKARNATNTIAVQADALRRALRLATQATSDYARHVRLTPSPAALTVRANAGGLDVRCEELAVCKSEIRSILFPAAQLLGLLREYAAHESITLRMSGEKGPCLISGNYHAEQETLIMPMKDTSKGEV